MSKRDLRNKFLELRSALYEVNQEEYFRGFSSNLSQMVSSKKITKIFAYKAFRNEPEIDFHSLRSAGYELFFPRIISDTEMVFLPDSDLNWEENKWGIKEPPFAKELIATPDEHTAVICPCIAVDRSGTRLGYGGGFYDRFINKFPQGLYVAMVFDDLIRESLPNEDTDRSVNIILSEKRVLEV